MPSGKGTLDMAPLKFSTAAVTLFLSLRSFWLTLFPRFFP
jgi:hypothetical protein